MVNLSAQRAAYAQSLDEARRRVVEILSKIPGIRRVSLVGSAARGRRDLFTDLDLLVIWDTDKPIVERSKLLHSLLDLSVDLDVICYTPREFRELRDLPFLRRLMSEEVVLYETQSA